MNTTNSPTPANRGWTTTALLLGASYLATMLATMLGCELPVAPPEKTATAPKPEYSETVLDEDPVPGEDPPPNDVTMPNVDKTSKTGEDPLFEPEDDQPVDKNAQDGGATDTSANREVVKAKPGAGKWKQYKPGFLTTPLNAYFSSKERIAYLQLEDGLKKFNALKGRNPKDFAEMEKEVLQPRRIRLPQLGQGDEYIYLPKQGRYGEIMIMRAEK